MSTHNAKPGTPVPLEIHDLTVAYHKRPVLWGVDVEVPAGQLVGGYRPQRRWEIHLDQGGHGAAAGEQRLGQGLWPAGKG